MFTLHTVFEILFGHLLGREIVDLYEGPVEVLGVFAHGDSLAKHCNWTASSHLQGSLSGPAGLQETRRPARCHVSAAQEALRCHPMCDVRLREEARADVFNLHLQGLHEIP